MECYRVVVLAAAALVGTAALAQGKTVCPVDKKPIPDVTKAQTLQVNRKQLALCSPKCAETFRKDPEKYLEKVAECPVLGNPVAEITRVRRMVLNNNLYYFCCNGCGGGFLTSPAHLKRLKDPVSGEVFEATSGTPKAEYRGQHYLFATEANKTAFEKAPEKYAVLFAP